jgi:hypothetical protein
MKNNKTVVGCDEQGIFTIRKYALLFLLAMLFSFGQAQTVTTVRQGNVRTEVTQAPTEAGLTKNAQKDGTTFKTCDGKIYPVYKSLRGKLFIVRVSKKTGYPYKDYSIPQIN